MSPIACPNCGAPAQVQAGQTTVLCTFCARSFQVAAPVPPPVNPFAAAPPSQSVYQPVHQIIVVPPGESMDMAAATVTAAGWAGFRILMALIPVVVIALVGGISYFATSNGGRSLPSSLGVAGWGGSTPLSCSGNDEITATDVTLSTTGAGITATGNCHVHCVRCTISAMVGITATANADVQLVDSHVTGTSQGIIAAENAVVRLVGNSTLMGQVIRTGNAEVVVPPGQGGGPVVARPPTKPTSGPSPAAPTHVPSTHH